jgi:hypothetical protein
MEAEKRFDTVLTGFIPGLIFPSLALVIIWLVRSGEGFFAFLVQSQRMDLLPKLISLAALPNLLIFFLFIWTHRNFSARGVIFATLVVAFVMLVVKIS